MCKYEHITVCGRIYSCYAVKKSGLSRSIRTDQRNDLISIDIQAQIVKRTQSPEIHAKVLNF